MAPSPDLGSSYALSLFSGAQATTVGLDEPNAFRHYLQCPHSQVGALAKLLILYPIATDVEISGRNLRSARFHC